VHVLGECNASRERSIENWAIRERGRVAREKVGWRVRKHLQNDEVIDYALDHSDLFDPSRAERVMFFAEPPKVRGTSRTLGVVLWPPFITFRWSRGKTREIYEIL